MQKVTFVQKKGQITLPIAIRQMFNLQPGSAVRVWAREEAIMIEPAQIVSREEPNEYLEILDEIAKKNNTTREKLLDEHKRIRHESTIKVYPGLWKKWQQLKKAHKNVKNAN